MGEITLKDKIIGENPCPLFTRRKEQRNGWDRILVPFKDGLSQLRMVWDYGLNMALVLG